MTEAKQAETEDAALEKAGLRTMLSLEQLLKIVPLSAVSIWRLERRNAFPRGSYISANRKVWFLDEIIAWQSEVDGRGRGRRNHPARRSNSAKG
jgi:prophage regulatory protein